jgi:hypothetical protein
MIACARELRALRVTLRKLREANAEQTLAFRVDATATVLSCGAHSPRNPPNGPRGVRGESFP